MANLDTLFDWLVDGAPGAPTPMAAVERVSSDLVAFGIPVARTEAFVRTLHPHIAGRSFVWTPGKPVEVVERTYAYLNSPEFLDGPVGEVFRAGRAVRLRASDGGRAAELLGPGGFSDYFAGPLRFTSGQVHAITFATRAPSGFRHSDVAAFERVLRPLSRIAEIMALTRTAANLLSTYVGHGAGERILAGKILRGDTEALRAIIWFSDLRGFTQLSSQLEPRQIIEVLNELFDCQLPPIDTRGGEVLKFIGDGLLAILPLEADAAKSCDAALQAADEAFQLLEQLNARKAQSGKSPIRFGLALHVGEVAYGNIGGSSRLDFTAIGPAVNLAARLEGLTGKLDQRLVVSAEFARLCSRPMETLGRFALKGVPGEQEAFAPRAG